MPDVAAFDFDGTLTDGGSVYQFLAAVGGRPKAASAALILSPRLVHGAVAGGAAADGAKEELFERMLAGAEATRVEQVAAQFARAHLDRHLRADVRARFDWHRDRGDRVVIVSASPEVYVREAGAILGADQVIATRLATDPQGALTGRYDGANCRGEEKLRRLQEWIGAERAAGSRLWAYGNSRGDLRMLGAADVGVNVGRLGRLGKLRRYPGLGGATGPDPA
jgi:phosphatidylglycerophosphatase C